MKAIAEALVILGRSIFSAGGAIAEAISKVSNAIPPGSASSASFIGFALVVIGAVVL